MKKKFSCKKSIFTSTFIVESIISFISFSKGLWKLNKTIFYYLQPKRKVSCTNRGGGMDMNADVCLWKHDKRKQRCWSRLRLCRLLFWSANVCVLKIQSSSSRRRIFQILDKVNNIIQVHCARRGGGGIPGNS